MENILRKYDITGKSNLAHTIRHTFESINAASESIKKLREKADRNFAKSEAILLKAAERKCNLAEREEKAVQLELHNRTTAKKDVKETAEISNRLQARQ